MQRKGTKYQVKRKQHNSFNLTDKNTIAELSQALKDIEKKYPILFSFLESYCGFYTPLNSHTPEDICYSQGKRDVILTIYTMMRDDINPEVIAQYYKQNL